MANFSTAYQILEEMGTLYNPSNTKIHLVNLDRIRTSLLSVITELNNKNQFIKMRFQLVNLPLHLWEN